MSELQAYAQQALQLIDLTSLNLDDTEQTIIDLCTAANTDYGHVAAVCVYPKFVALARGTLDKLGLTNVKVATVTNFPSGEESLTAIIKETNKAVADGADEVDVVLPYRAFMKGDLEHCEQVLTKSKAACGDKTLLKVIIESGEMLDDSFIKAASEFAIDCGVDFIKTSTGKVPVNATLEAADIMLAAINTNNPNVGFKAAGGIRTANEAKSYLKLAEDKLGNDWINPAHFRFGASSLLGNLVDCLNGKQTTSEAGTSTY